MIAGLKELSERPWVDWNHGQGLTPAALASHLRQFGTPPLALKSRKTRLSNARTANRWHREDFEDAWSRSLPQELEQSEHLRTDAAQPPVPNPELYTVVPDHGTPIQPMSVESVPDVPGTTPLMGELEADNDAGLF